MRRHYARYTPEMVEEVCGVPRQQWLQVVQTLIENSGRERTGSIAYSLGFEEVGDNIPAKQAIMLSTMSSTMSSTV